MTGRVLIVEDGLSSYVLPVVRSLATAGWSVGIAGPRVSRAASSRHLSGRHVVPPAETGLDEFALAVADVVRAGRYDLVLGADDVEVLALSAVRDRIPAIFPYAEDAVVRTTFDKLALSRAAAAAGIATPTIDEPTAVPTEFPVVVKARLHWTPGAVTASGRLSAAVCSDADELAAALATVRAAGGEPIIQRAVPGDLMAFTVLLDRDGTVHARVQQRALAISPFLRTSVRAVTEPVDEALAEQVTALLRGLGWVGLANLQFLAPETGPPRLIDFNGRIYGSIALAIRAGVDFPGRWAALALGRPTDSRAEARVGVRYQALEEDLRRARLERRRGLVSDVVGCLRFAPGAAHSTWQPGDPAPAMRRVGGMLGRRLTRRPSRQDSADHTSAATT